MWWNSINDIVNGLYTISDVSLQGSCGQKRRMFGWRTWKKLILSKKCLGIKSFLMCKIKFCQIIRENILFISVFKRRK